MRTPQQSSFTVVELLVASALSVLVAAMVLTILVKNTEAWREGMARLHLSEQSRIARERILRGIDGKYGLRSARRSDLVFTSDEVMLTDAGSTNRIILILAPNQPPAWLDYSGTNPILRSDAFVDSAALSRTGDVFYIELALGILSGRRIYSQPQQIRVYLLNE